MFRSSTSSSYILFATTIFKPTMLRLKLILWRIGAQTRTGSRNPRRFCFKWDPESITFCCGIRKPGLGIRNTAQGIRNPTNDWNPESKFHLKNPESST